MGLQDLFNWRSQTAVQTAASMPAVADEDLAADVDEPPDHRSASDPTGFHKSTIRPQSLRQESLLTKALKSPELEETKPKIHVATDLSRRRSMISNASLASTAELTSDGGLTSPARTNTPSPPPPSTTYASFSPYLLASKPFPPAVPIANVEIKESIAQLPDAIAISPKAQPPVEVAPKKRCITFACGAKRSPVSKPAVVPQPLATAAPTEAPKRSCTIKFACAGPKPSDKTTKVEAPKTPQISKATEPLRRNGSRSPSMTRKSPRPGLSSTRTHPTSNRRVSQSPVAVRAKPKFIFTDEKTIESSEATRFHEFASGEVQEDDWIRKDSENPREKLTISDTLKKENAIRKLGNEAEEEALEEAENEDEDEQDGGDSDDENGFDDDLGNDSLDGSEVEASDGNETDNEAGFADSDDESDCDGEFAFWTPGRSIMDKNGELKINYRASAHRTASASSIESLGPLSSIQENARKPRRKSIKIRPGTPDLPDSTDFVCGTLDEDRPLENAYVSCMEARKHAKHKPTPQDIDPSFPTSDPENEEDENDAAKTANDSDEHVWLHGKFEDSDEERHGRRGARRKSPGQSPKRFRSPPPKRLHSPPPTKTRLRSPPPRKLFGRHSPKRMRSPPPARTVRSPPASPTTNAPPNAISFAPLGSRPGLTHTKSLPRTPNAFCRQYRADRLAAANGNNDDSTDGHVRGAIDIIKGLEQKHQRRKEKFYQKINRKGKQPERKPQPGKGAERMRELGLHMAGKATDAYMMSA